MLLKDAPESLDVGGCIDLEPESLLACDGRGGGLEVGGGGDMGRVLSGTSPLLISAGGESERRETVVCC